jgi:hypothetical protein
MNADSHAEGQAAAGLNGENFVAAIPLFLSDPVEGAATPLVYKAS